MGMEVGVGGGSGMGLLVEGGETRGDGCKSGRSFRMGFLVKGGVDGGDGDGVLKCN